jgi:hypothetical protein
MVVIFGWDAGWTGRGGMLREEREDLVGVSWKVDWAFREAWGLLIVRVSIGVGTCAIGTRLPAQNATDSSDY